MARPRFRWKDLPLQIYTLFCLNKFSLYCATHSLTTRACIYVYEHLWRRRFTNTKCAAWCSDSQPHEYKEYREKWKRRTCLAIFTHEILVKYGLKLMRSMPFQDVHCWNTNPFTNFYFYCIQSAIQAPDTCRFLLFGKKSFSNEIGEILIINKPSRENK